MNSEDYQQRETNWGGLFNKKRFEWMIEEKDRYLKDLSLEKGIAMLESLTSQEVLNGLKKVDTIHSPLCLKLGLKKRKDDLPF